MIFLLLVATSQVKAQSVDVVIRENGTERKESIDLPKSMTYPLDSLLNDWKAKNYIDLGKDCSTAEINPLFSDSVYIDRLSRIPAVMEILREGSVKAREVAAQTLSEVKHAMKIDYFEDPEFLSEQIKKYK